MALVSQPPWIQNSTVRNNILFGSVYDETRYRNAVSGCCLERDFSVLPNGDQTIAGLNGAVLSGGQKWRVALARELYSAAEILILDDVLSAVDTRVARQVFDHGIMGDLAKRRTIILVTHNPDAYLASAEYHVTIENGHVSGKSVSRTLPGSKMPEPSLPPDPSPEVISNEEEQPRQPEHPKERVESRQRVGIVGRTGSGKTTLTNAILRFIDVAQGQIIIDGVNVSTLKLNILRKAITLIPQDPFLSSRTLRSNVNLSGTKSDSLVLEVLRRVHLIPTAATKDVRNHTSEFFHLDMEIKPGGVNLSYGQRQLLCLARALLDRCPILILDEATSGVDDATDTAVQRVLREQFSHATILVVAHRLLTVADFDSILVMRDGNVAEIGPPRALTAKRGLFWDMVQQTGDCERVMQAMRKD
ncbi:ABC transporter-like protein [Beauveria brongniartii RCEF 3172]|uniref:ABC transporter-like protein n=1 Tax=Beauveria brongniartii RCEF 3172 TaxID=1081107 RepID=A0A167A3K8_9HYPO|nr:ABC transporter-like protein [Beauveria brongniartii RCEF 3172]